MAAIDQGRRLEIMRRIADGEQEAVEELASLYESCGYATLAKATRLANTREEVWETLKWQAALFIRECAHG